MSQSRYPRQCYLMLKAHDDSGKNNWATNIKNMLFEYGFGYAWIFQEIGNVNLFIYLFKQRLVDCYTQKWRNDINASNRCLHYKNFKSLLNVEKYLLLDIPFVYKRSFSKFRCSNHKLTIETGRHINIPSVFAIIV